MVRPSQVKHRAAVEEMWTVEEVGREANWLRIDIEVCAVMV